MTKKVATIGFPRAVGLREDLVAPLPTRRRTREEAQGTKRGRPREVENPGLEKRVNSGYDGAVSLYHEGKFELALASFDAQIVAGYSTFRLLVSKAKCLIELGRGREAEVIFDSVFSAIEETEETRTYHSYWKARVCIEEGEWREAEKLFMIVLSNFNMEILEYYSYDIYNFLGYACYKQGKENKAAKCFLKCRDFISKNKLIRHRTQWLDSLCCICIKRNYIEYAYELIQYYKMSMGVLTESTQQIEAECVERLTQEWIDWTYIFQPRLNAIDFHRSKDSKLYEDAGHCLLKLSDTHILYRSTSTIRQALKYLLMAYEDKPSVLKNHSALGVCYYRLNDYQEALKHFTLAYANRSETWMLNFLYKIYLNVKVEEGSLEQSFKDMHLSAYWAKKKEAEKPTAWEIQYMNYFLNPDCQISTGSEESPDTD